MKHLTWKMVDELIEQAVSRMLNGEGLSSTPIRLWGVPRGGSIVARLLSGRLQAFGIETDLLSGGVPDAADGFTVIVDDIIDSGMTMERLMAPSNLVVALCRSTQAPVMWEALPVFDEWVQFPWEGEEEGPEDNVIRLLTFMGEDPRRDGLKDTPKRVVKAFKEMTIGYSQDPHKILNRQFEQTHDEMVILKGISFTSLCEHHLMPFTGTASVGYIPREKVVGISKLARLVSCFAKRLQIQERLTDNIAHAVDDVLNPLGVGVVIKAQHHCMICRGVEQSSTEMITSCMLGYLRDRPEARNEFMLLVK